MGAIDRIAQANAHGGIAATGNGTQSGVSVFGTRHVAIREQTPSSAKPGGVDMDELKWIEYDQSKWHRQKLPPERRYVRVQVGDRGDYPAAVAVGYMKFSAGCKDSPNFIVPGVGGPVTHWADCLGDMFEAPLWRGKQTGASHD